MIRIMLLIGEGVINNMANINRMIGLDDITHAIPDILNYSDEDDRSALFGIILDAVIEASIDILHIDKFDLIRLIDYEYGYVTYKREGFNNV